MSRRSKYLKRILWGLLLTPIVLVLLVSLLLYVPPVQNFVVHRLASYLSEQTGMKITLDRIHLSFPLDLSVEGLDVVRAPGDTLLSVGELSLSPSLRPLLDKQIEVPHITLDRFALNYTDSTGLSTVRARLPKASVEELYVDLEKERVDLSRLVTRGGSVSYTSTDTTKKEDDSEPLRWLIRAGEVDLQTTRIDVAMPLDSLFIGADVTRLRLDRGEADLAKMRFQIARARIEGRELSYAVDRTPPRAPYFDPSHIHLRDIYLEGESIDSEGMRLSLLLSRAQFNERSGLKLHHLSGRYEMDSLGMCLDDFILDTDGSSMQGALTMPWSVLRSDPKAGIELTMKASLGTRDLLLLSYSALDDLPEGKKLLTAITRRQLLAPIRLSLETHGTLSTLELTEADLHWPDVVRLSLKGHLTSLLDEHRRSGKLRLTGQVGTKAQTLLSLVSPELSRDYRIPSPMTLSGEVDIRRGVYKGDLKAVEGSGQVALKGHFTEATKSYALSLKAEGLDLRHFMPRDSIGRLSLELDAEGRGFDPLSPRTRLSLRGRVHQASWGSTTLHDVTLDGSLKDGNLGLSLNSMNPGANFSLQLDGIFSRQGFTTGIGLDLVELDLQRLGFSDTPLSAKLRLEGELRSDMKETHSFTAAADGISFVLGGERLAPPRADLQLSTSPEDMHAELTSGDMKASLHVGAGPTSTQVQLTKLMDETLQQVRLITSGKSATKYLEDLVVHLPTSTLSLTMGKDNPLRYYLADQHVALGSLSMKLETSPREGLSGTLALSDLRVDTLRINSAQLNLSTERQTIARGDSLSLVLFGTVMKSRYRSQEGFTISTDLRTSLQSGHLDFSWQDERGEVRHTAEVEGSWSGEAYQLHFIGDRLRLAYNDYKINPENSLSLRKKDYFLLGSLQLAGEKRGEFSLLAEESTPGVQDITLGIHKLYLEDYRSLGLPDIGGIFFGDVHYQRKGDFSQQPTISGDLSISDLRYEDKKLGHFTSSLFYEPRSGDSHYITADIGYNGQSAMTIDGIYHPREKTSPLSGTLTLNAFPLELANPFLAANATSLKGTAEGSIRLSGKLTEPLLSGKMNLSDAMVHLDSYGMHLVLDSMPVRLENSDIYFDHYAVRPSVDTKKAIYLDGSIRKSTTPQATASLRITSDELTLLDEPRPRRDDQLLYGRIIASTNMNVSGPMTSLRVRGGINVLSGTNCTYILREDPLKTGEQSDELVQFVDFSDTLFTKSPEVVPPTLGGLDVNLTIHVDPSVRIGADLTADGADYLHAQGGGTLHFTYPPYGEMSMTGRYEMSGGGELSYTLPVVGNKRFTISPTSTLSWYGSISNPYLDFSAVNKVKATVTSSSGSSERVNFNVSIEIKDYVNRMNLGFSLAAPENLSMQNTLSTMTKEEQSKQAIALMATGIYLGSGTGAGNLNLNSALTSLLQSQINKAAGKLLQGTDLSLGMDHYDGSSGEAARTDYTYSFSRRFHNDRIRIIVGGKVQSGAGAPNQGQTFLDNVSLQYQLDKSGEQYLSLYHKRVTDNILEGEFSETGVGYVLRRKLSSLRDLFRFRAKKVKRDTLPKASIQEWRLGGDTTTVHSTDSTPVVRLQSK